MWKLKCSFYAHALFNKVFPFVHISVVKKLISAGGKAMETVERLYAENGELRQQLRESYKEILALQEKHISVVQELKKYRGW